MTQKIKKRKLLLINPLSTTREGLILHSHVIYPPIGLGIVAALTPDHWDVEIMDENFKRFTYKEADLVAFTALTSTLPNFAASCTSANTSWNKLFGDKNPPISTSLLVLNIVLQR